MSSEHDPNGQWERVAQELRACCESQRKSWGHIDSSTLGRYLAGEVSGHERAEVENALEELPELRKLTDLVLDVLADLAPIEIDPPAAPAPVPVLSFPSQPELSRIKRFATFLRRRSSLAAAACLLLTFGLAMPKPGFVPAPSSERITLTNAVASAKPGPRSALTVREGEEVGALLGQPRILAVDDKHSTSFKRGPGNSLPALKGHTSDLKSVAFAPDGKRAESSGNDGRVRLWDQSTARELNRMALSYSSRGDLVNAVPLQCRAHQMCQEKLGPNHPTTQKTARYLAFAYQTALNSPGVGSCDSPALGVGGGSGKMRPARRGGPGASLENKGGSGGVEPQQGAVALREQIVDRTTREVQSSVVPVLTQALRVEPDAQKRMNLVRAIASLGPAGGNAVPVLTERLQSSNDPTEVLVVLEALDELGPAACEAVPTLEALSDKCSDRAGHKRAYQKDKFGGHHGKKVESSARFGVSEEKGVRQALARLNSPQGRAGVEDGAGCFSVRAVCLANRALRDLAQKSEVEIIVKTVPPHALRKKHVKGRDNDFRFHKMGERAIHVVFARDGSNVEVLVSDSLRRAGVTAEKCRKSLQERLRQRQYDKALDESIKLVSEIARAK